MYLEDRWNSLIANEDESFAIVEKRISGVRKLAWFQVFHWKPPWKRSHTFFKSDNFFYYLLFDKRVKFIRTPEKNHAKTKSTRGCSPWSELRVNEVTSYLRIPYPNACSTRHRKKKSSYVGMNRKIITFSSDHVYSSCLQLSSGLAWSSNIRTKSTLITNYREYST